jgi:hypothetical protein
MMAEETLGDDTNGMGATHHPCAEPVWRLPVHGVRCRTLSLCHSLLLRALGCTCLTCVTGASLALYALEEPHLAKKSPFARAGPSRREMLILRRALRYHWRRSIPRLIFWSLPLRTTVCEVMRRKTSKRLIS